MGTKRAEKNKKRLAKRKAEKLKREGRTRNPRVCGPCYACCKVQAMEGVPQYDGDKPAGETCKQVTESESARCGMHADRPSSCKGYQCVWLHDGGQPKRFFYAHERPDILGVLFDLTGPEHLATKALGGRPVVIAREFREGAYDTNEVRDTFDRLLRQGKVIATVKGSNQDEYNFIARNPKDANAVALAYKKLRVFNVLSNEIKAQKDRPSP